MNHKKEHWILYLISATILLSILALIYFNFINYQLNKTNFIQNIQQSIDVATDNYFTDRAKNKKEKFKLFFKKFDKQNNINSLKVNSKKNNTSFSISVNKNKKDSFAVKYSSTKILFSPTNKDSLNQAKQLETILISITDNPINLKKLDSVFKKELNRRHIKTAYKITYISNEKNNDTIAIKDSISYKKLNKNHLITQAKSTFLDKNEKIEVLFNNNTFSVLKDGLIGILLSLILSLTIISSLFYLLYIIKKQKQIAEIKNDFISNITHEFKTPITTIHTAIEAIKDFNAAENKLKTQEYLNISKNQLEKLNIMVEKILETASLDSEKLLLHKKNVDLIALIKELITQAKTLSNKQIDFKTEINSLQLKLDKFHIRNAIQNLLDNAIKYGGNQLVIQVLKTTGKVQIAIKDSGEIPTSQREKIFEKFYRIPKGNKHDVKGFGIGLYYAKNIIEKHNGTLKLAKTKQTVFIIELPTNER